MPINQNHLLEDLNGIKGTVVEKNVSKQRVEFLKSILEFNHYTVIVVPSPPPKTATAPIVKPGDVAPELPTPEPALNEPETFTVGVKDYTFNTINAIFGRLLKTPDGHVVTLAYWNQKETESHDEIPY